MLRIKSERAEVWLQGISSTKKPLGPISLSLKETKSVVLALEELSNLIFHITVNCHFIHFN